MNRRKALIVPSAFCVFIMLWKAFQQAPFVPCKWNSVMLSFSYRYGFIQRGFLGTIIDVLSDIFPISFLAKSTNILCSANSFGSFNNSS